MKYIMQTQSQTAYINASEVQRAIMITWLAHTGPFYAISVSAARSTWMALSTFS